MISVPLPRKHISLVICVSLLMKPIYVMICVSLPREHIFLVIYVPLPGKHEPKGVVKVKIAQNNSQISEGGITVKPGQDSIYELII